MNLVNHKNMLFAGTATAFEYKNYTGHTAFIYVKQYSNSAWKLDTYFEKGSERIGAMESCQFFNDKNGNTIKNGPVSILIAATIRTGRRGPGPVEVRIRDDQSEKWKTVELHFGNYNKYNIREISMHRDSVTGADMVFIASCPHPLGLISGVYDQKSNKIVWANKPELTYQPERGTPKWFGMDEVNGVLLASNNRYIYRRIDGKNPRWIKVADLRTESNRKNAEIRGVTSVFCYKETGWHEKNMLLFSSRMSMWIMKVPKNASEKHEMKKELDLLKLVKSKLSKSIVFAEAAFNRLNLTVSKNANTQFRCIGFQVLSSLRRKEPVAKDCTSYALYNYAHFLLRKENGEYKILRISDIKERVFPATMHNFHF